MARLASQAEPEAVIPEVVLEVGEELVDLRVDQGLEVGETEVGLEDMVEDHLAVVEKVVVSDHVQAVDLETEVLLEADADLARVEDLLLTEEDQVVIEAVPAADVVGTNFFIIPTS